MVVVAVVASALQAVTVWQFVELLVLMADVLVPSLTKNVVDSYTSTLQSVTCGRHCSQFVRYHNVMLGWHTVLDVQLEVSEEV